MRLLYRCSGCMNTIRGHWPHKLQARITAFNMGHGDKRLIRKP